jgi:hypothetical protein
MKESDFQNIRAAIEALGEVFNRSLTDAALDLYVRPSVIWRWQPSTRQS